MNEEVARSGLRIIGVVTMLVGGILTTQAVIAQVALTRSLEAAPGVQFQTSGMLGDLGAHAIVAQAVTVAFGLLLFFLSPILAARVAK